MTIKATTDRAALVDTEFHWIKIEHRPPPISAKVLLINRDYGTAVIGIWDRGQWWTHWAPLPTFRREDAAL